ncbi:catalase-like domain-containing protein [Gautieria morchelliformis]|nr:catalase-like domain-containing protein [Gautieria morchelliformis]
MSALAGETAKIADLRHNTRYPPDSADAKERMRTDHGTKIADPENWCVCLDLWQTGPALLEDQVGREKIHRFDHERIPERVVHARGTGAHGYFKVYDDRLAKYTSARVLTDPARTTPVFVRFSTVQGSRGSADTVRDVRGFAVKFYTDEGNWDLVGNNIPVFFIQDGVQFPDFVHAVKPEPHNEAGYSHHNNFWDFAYLQSQTTHMLCWIMSDRGIPRSFRMMQGFGVNTFTLLNAEGRRVFVKFHWLPELGVHSLTWDEALKISGQDPDFHRKDLQEAIENGAFPKWKLAVQILEGHREHSFDFDILDATKIWPEDQVPLQEVGELVLNRTVDEFFPEVEQVAFCTSHVVPGIGFSNDPLLQTRNFSYFDTQISRLGINWEELPINRPVCPVMNFNRDGKGRHTVVKSQVNYHPNRFDVIRPEAEDTDKERPKAGGAYKEFQEHIEGVKERTRSDKFQEHFSQAQLFYNSLAKHERAHLVSAFSFELSHCDDPKVYENMSARLSKIDHELAQQVALNVGGEPVPEKAAQKNHERRSKGLSQGEFAPKEATMKTRRIAILIADGVNVAEVEELRTAIKKAGATAWLIGPRRGTVYGAGQTARHDTELAADHHFEGQRSTLFDAVIVPSGKAHAERLAKNGRAVHWVREAFGHLKAIGAVGEGVGFLQRAVELPGVRFASKGDEGDLGKVVDSYGVVTTLEREAERLVKGDDSESFLSRFKMEVSAHRNWQRELDGLVQGVAF